MMTRLVYLGAVLTMYRQDNTGINCTEYGLLITQSYPSTLGTPGNGVAISVSDLVKHKASY